MIKYIILNTDLITVTIFNDDVTFYIGKNCLDLPQQLLNFDIKPLFNSIFGSTRSFTDATSLGHFDPPKPLNSQNLNNLVPIFNGCPDILNNIGSRPNIFISISVDRVLNQIPFFIGSLVMLVFYIKSLLRNTVNSISKFLSGLAPRIPCLGLEKNLPLKESTEYLTSKFFKYINYNYIPEHLRNFKVFSFHNVRSTQQDQDREITRILMDRNSIGGDV
jgi:hypothetical protein